MKTQLFIFSLLLMNMSQSSHAHIIKGLVPAKNQFKNVMKFEYESTRGKKAYCTATIISSRTLLTAAHCVSFYLDNPENASVSINGLKHTIKDVMIPEEWPVLDMISKEILTGLATMKAEKNFGREYKEALSELQVAQEAMTYFEIALVQMTAPIDPSLERTELSFEIMKPKDEVILLGFGLNKYEQTDKRWAYTGETTLHYGFNSIADSGADHLEIFGILEEATSDESLTGPGDSGGPLLMKNSKKQVAVLRGVKQYDGFDASAYAPLAPWKEFIQVNAL